MEKVLNILIGIAAFVLATIVSGFLFWYVVQALIQIVGLFLNLS